MNKVKINFYKLPIPEKIQMGYGILGAMEGNPNFPDAAARLEVLEAAVKKLEEAFLAALHGDRIKNALMVLAAEELRVQISSMAGYVHSVCSGNLEMILSSGFEAHQTGVRNPTRPVETPAFLRVRPGRLEGEIIFNWGPEHGARSYTAQISEDNGGTWEDCPMSTRSKIVVSGLTSGSRPWFRVSAFGILGHSDWSDAVQGKVA